MKRTSLVAFASGVLFAVGLAIAGMTSPTVILAFLDIAGDWDPSLAFVMVGAILVHAPFALRAKQPGAQPVLADQYALPEKQRIDARLLLGQALFGAGWGASGFCPGPALVSLAAPVPSTLLFVSCMLLGMWLQTLLPAKTSAARARASFAR